MQPKITIEDVIDPEEMTGEYDWKDLLQGQYNEMHQKMVGSCWKVNDYTTFKILTFVPEADLDEAQFIIVRVYRNEYTTKIYKEYVNADSYTEQLENFTLMKDAEFDSIIQKELKSMGVV